MRTFELHVAKRFKFLKIMVWPYEPEKGVNFCDFVRTTFMDRSYPATKLKSEACVKVTKSTLNVQKLHTVELW